MALATSSTMARFDSVFCVPGQPVTHLTDLMAAAHPGFEWAPNEKVALESAIGVSAAGHRAALVMKQNGLNLALDPLINAVYHGIGGGIVVVVGDDVDASSSTCIQDSRLIGRAAQLPVIEPASGDAVDRLLCCSLEVSEISRTPVLFRITADLHRSFQAGSSSSASCSGNELGEQENIAREPQRIDTIMAHHLTKLGRHQRHRLNTWPAVEQVLARSQLATARHARHCERGVIAVGSAARLVERSDVCRLVVESSWPIPTEVWEFLLTHNSVVVAEEPAPFLERELHVSGGSCATRLRGRDSGHLPPEGWLVDADISASLGVGRPAGSWTTFATKTFDQVTPHQYEVLFRAVGRLHADGVFVSADVGSSVKLCYPPYNGADVALCLGSAISVAGGSARHEGPSIAVVGDYGLMHSGIEALIDVVRRHLPVLVLLLANGVSAQTGNQPTSVSPFGDGAPPLRLRPLLEAIGVAHVEQWDIADRHADETLETLRSLLGGSLPAVALVTAGPGIA